ncbi:MAG: glycogen/starch/alpha-glucan phosphorylase, partial [Ruminiclostridium sp.]|nr:glycogen/starch/alpha-glucan phosphorylase [Ruminiclostridium sp.]
MKSPFTAAELSKKLKDNLVYDFRINPDEATSTQIYKALSKIVVDHLKEKRHAFMRKVNSEGKKQVYYISMEFLMGRSLKTSLFNIGLNEVAEDVLKKDFDIKIDTIYEEEPDAGLGNGGLGRLAACYMDGMATCAYPATGYSLLY